MSTEPTPSDAPEGEIVYWQARSGIAPIKKEYVMWEKMRSGSRTTAAADDDAAEGRTTDSRPPNTRPAPAAEGEGDAGEGGDGEPPAKKVRLSGAQKKAAARARGELAWQAKKAAKAEEKEAKRKEKEGATSGETAVEEGEAKEGDAPEEEGEEEGAQGGGRKRATGQNKNRKFDHQAGVALRLCPSTAKGLDCPRLPACKASHDLAAYLASRIPDIPFALPTSSDDLTPILTPRPCPIFLEFGTCPYGFKCQFSESHIRKVEDGKGFQGTGLELVVDEEKVKRKEAEKGEGKAALGDKGEMNVITMSQIGVIRGQGKTTEERFPLSAKYLASIGEPLDSRGENRDGRGGRGGGRGGKGGRGGGGRDGGRGQNQQEAAPVISEAVMDVDPSPADPAASTAAADAPTSVPAAIDPMAVGAEHSDSTISDTSGLPDLAPIRAAEKKRLDFRGKLYLAPLTTVGNLPFRRLCVGLGADITCSEMGLAQEFMNGNNNEWSLVRRHPSEKLFGLQICGNKPQVLVPTAEILARSCEIDFLDVNCGCPIDLVFNKGAGSALLGSANKLGKALVGMSQVLGEIPLTIKIRSGITGGSPVAHKLVTRMQKEWGVSAVTIHGRSRQQRYKQLADYTYIGQVAKTLRETASDEGLAPIPIFGNGDAYDYRAYYENMESSGVDGIMIARGALVKPWIFTEIKERRDWDISSRERLDMIGQLATFGLEHWGSDTQGINITRRFLLESLSFQHRYVPVGLLERFPVSLNERAYPYRGRDQLETLLASDQADDWIKVSNMFLGPPPDDWVFLPKHKANSSEEVQG